MVVILKEFIKGNENGCFLGGRNGGGVRVIVFYIKFCNMVWLFKFCVYKFLMKINILEIDLKRVIYDGGEFISSV